MLIYGADYINAPFVYAYSVDDAVGNMQVDGDGLILAVGGVNGLPNPNHATPFINVSFGGAKTDRVQFTKYGVCTTYSKQTCQSRFPQLYHQLDQPQCLSV